MYLLLCLENYKPNVITSETGATVMSDFLLLGVKSPKLFAIRQLIQVQGLSIIILQTACYYSVTTSKIGLSKGK